MPDSSSIGTLSKEDDVTPMQILVLGGGAIGGLIAGYMAGAGHEVVVVDNWESHVRTMNDAGIFIGGEWGEHNFRVRAVLGHDLQDAGEQDLVFISSKSNDTDYMIDLARPYVGERTTVISTQNGVNEEAIAQAFGPNRVVGCVTRVGATLVEPGHIEVTTKRGMFIIGELDGKSTNRCNLVAALLGACATAEITENIMGHLWSKLIWNCMTNAPCGVAGVGAGRLLHDNDWRKVVFRIAAEALPIATELGVHLEPLPMLDLNPVQFLPNDTPAFQAIERRLLDFYANFMDLEPSLLQDIRKGRPTEIRYLNGYLSSKGKEIGIPTPVNDRITGLVQEIEDGVRHPQIEAAAEFATF